MINKKKDFGQFNTTRKNYILNGFEWFVRGKSWIDPFAGNCDLLDWVKQHGATDTKGYDIDKTKKICETRNTLLNPPNYEGKWVIANPPYLAMNKNENKELYEKYDLDDYYKIAIKTVCNNNCEGGIFIVPLNFLSSENSDIRKCFFHKYKIISCKVFEERVFEDTDYTVCAFFYEKDKPKDKDILNITFMPRQIKKSFEISEKYGWIAGQEFYEWVDGISTKGIGRWTLDNYKGPVPHAQSPNMPLGNGSVKLKEFIIAKNDFKKNIKELCDEKINDNIILIRAIDTGTVEGKIKLQDINELNVKCLIGLHTSRNFASVKFDVPPPISEQKKVIDSVNEKLESFREEYNSIFLTAYRNSTKLYSRKRIGFDMMYKMIKKSLGRIN